MNPKYAKLIPILSVLLLFVLLGGPQMALAQSATPQNQNVQPTPDAQSATPQNQNAQPAPDTQATTPQTGTTEPPAALPEAPSQQAAPAQQTVGTPALPQDAQPQAQPKKQDQAPAGAAAAQKGETAGGAASKPAGAAIAPAKHRQVRSFLLKLGLIAAGGAAIGTVYALSRGTSSVPPGSGR